MRQNKSFFELVKADYKLVSKVSETWFVPSITNSKHNTRYIHLRIEKDYIMIMIDLSIICISNYSIL